MPDNPYRHLPNDLSAASRFNDERLTGLRCPRRVRMPRNDETDLRECFRYAELLFKREVPNNNDKIGNRLYFRQRFPHCIQNVRDRDGFQIFRMRDLTQVFNGEPDNADADSLDREDRIRPHLFYACHVCRKDWKSRFLQPAPQLRQTVVKFMIAESSGTVSQMIHDVDHGLSVEFIADHRSREHVAAIKKHVRLFAADHCSEMRQPTGFAAGQHLTVHVICVEDDEVRRGLGKEQVPP